MTTAETISAIAAAVAAISVMVGAGFAVFGISAWRREFVGRRRIELAENVLAKFYKARDAIRVIRNPLSSIDESASRKRLDSEHKAESQVLDKAYVVFERFNKQQEVFVEIRALKYRFMATFGAATAASFDELVLVIHDIKTAAELLGSFYWQRQGRVKMSEAEHQDHLVEMHRYEAVFWNLGDKNDEIGPRVDAVVAQVEEVTREATQSKTGLFRRLPGRA